MTTQLLVANTRPRGQAAELSTLLRAADFAVLEAPAIRVLPVGPSVDLPPPHSYAWVVLPSQNAAHHFPAAESAFQDARVLCGAATAAMLGLRHAETLEPFSARAAFDWLRSRVRADDHVLVPRAENGRDELVLGLRGLGIHVDAPVTYRSVPAPPDELQALAAANVITLCSPSAASAVIAALDVSGLGIPLVCLGQTTAGTVEAHGLRVAAVADHTSMPSLVEAVRKTLAAPGLEAV